MQPCCKRIDSQVDGISNKNRFVYILFLVGKSGYVGQQLPIRAGQIMQLFGSNMQSIFGEECMKEIEDNCRFGSMSAEACCSWPNSWRDIKGQLEMGCITPDESPESSNNHFYKHKNWTVVCFCLWIYLQISCVYVHYITVIP